MKFYQFLFFFCIGSIFAMQEMKIVNLPIVPKQKSILKKNIVDQSLINARKTLTFKESIKVEQPVASTGKSLRTSDDFLKEQQAKELQAIKKQSEIDNEKQVKENDQELRRLEDLHRDSYFPDYGDASVINNASHYSTSITLSLASSIMNLFWPSHS